MQRRLHEGMTFAKDPGREDLGRTQDGAGVAAVLALGNRCGELDSFRARLGGNAAGDALRSFTGQRTPILGDPAAAGNDRVAG